MASDWGGYRKVFSIGGGIISAITQDGQLLWFKHLGFANGAPEWEGPMPVATGWGDYEQVFSGGGSGVIYAIGTDGVLHWYKHIAYLEGLGPESPGAWSSRAEVGHGWHSFTHVFGQF